MRYQAYLRGGGAGAMAKAGDNGEMAAGESIKLAHGEIMSAVARAMSKWRK
jgi:hypothetical protein